MFHGVYSLTYLYNKKKYIKKSIIKTSEKNENQMHNILKVTRIKYFGWITESSG